MSKKKLKLAELPERRKEHIPEPPTFGREFKQARRANALAECEKAIEARNKKTK